MDNFTVGYVSGAIAAAVAVAQFLVPNALALVLVAALSDTHSAVTWSVVGRALGGTHWPLALRSDQTTSYGVSRRVSLITWIKPLVLLLIAVAAIVTPMGLYETIAASEDLENTVFFHVEDRGLLGLGTAPRMDLGMSRKCGNDFVPKICPGSAGSMNTSRDDRWINTTTEGWDWRIPEDLAQLYQSGLKSQQSTVSSFFDIESRLYDLDFNSDQDNQTYIVDYFRAMGTFVLTERASAVDGLVLDIEKARIGFRNHTAPTRAQFGAEWEEDLLFLEPETRCVNTNVSVHFNTPDVVKGDYDGQMYLVDDGGFVDMDIENPWVCWTRCVILRAKMGPDFIWYENTQEDAQLEWRARSSAWSMNLLHALYFNVTKAFDRAAYLNSEVGKIYPVNGSEIRSALNQITTFDDFNHVIELIIPTGYEVNGTLNFSDPIKESSWPNPFNISSANFTYLENACQGGDDDPNGSARPANITNIYVKCGLVKGTSQPLDGGEKALIPRPGTKWARPVYSCASAVKSTIKTVRFRYNSTSNDLDPIRRLEVVSISDKNYPTEDDLPLWGVENANFTIPNIDPLWGLIDPAQAEHVNLSTIRSDHLYLPAGYSSIFSAISSGSSYIPAGTVPTKIWSSVYDVDDTSSIGIDYSGSNNLGLYSKWDNLTRTTSGTEYMMNLIWMDFAANSLTGSRGQLSTSLLPLNLAPGLKSNNRMIKRDDESGDSASGVPVHLYHRAIRYRWVYGIPAFLTALVVGLICLTALVTVLIGRASPSRVQHFLWNLSAGRILTSFLYPGTSHMQSETKEWIQNVGNADVTITRSWGAHGGLGPQSTVTAEGAAGGSGFAGMTTSYERVAQREEEEARREEIAMKSGGVAETKPLVAEQGISPEVQYRMNAGRGVNEDYVVRR